MVGRYYRIERHVKNGGWASVYKARRRSNKELYALKTIRPELAGDPEYQRLFEREQTALRQLQHPNLRPAVDWGQEEDGLMWLVMPWIDGVTLRDLVREGPLSPTQAADLFAQAAEGLHAVHTEEPRLVHRDLHPGNLMIENGSRMLVIDFGLAKRFEHSSGSPFMPRPGRWSSPEAVRGDDLTQRADIYSLGLLLAYAVTGAEPERNRPVLQRNFRVPRRLRAIIREATAPEERRRFQSAQKMAGSLREFQHQAERERRMIALGGAVALAVVAVTASFFAAASLSGSDSDQERRIAAGEASALVPESWRPVAASAGERQGGLRRGAEGEGTKVLLGMVSPQFAYRLSASPDVYEVSLPAGRALRVDRPEGIEADRLFLFRVGSSYPVLACQKNREQPPGTCAEIATTVEMPEASKLPQRPGRALRRQATRSLNRYAAARASVTEEIAVASDATAAAAAAAKAAAAASEAAKIARKPRLSSLRLAFAVTAKAWERAARMARRENRAGFSRMGDRVKQAERSIARARAHLAKYGFRPEVR